MTAPRSSTLLAALAAALLIVGTAAGMLCVRIDDYDDAWLLMGARLTAAGRLPVRDFYTHYGPLGFRIQSLFSAALPNPALALRAGQVVFFAALVILAFLAARRLDERRGAAWTAALYALALSPAALLPSFYGLGLALASLGALIVARGCARPGAMRVWAMVSGIALAATLLTRPAFAFYAAFAVLLTCAAAGARSSASRVLLGSIAVGFTAAAALLWLAFFARLPIVEVLDATIRVPARLMGGGGRYREAPFLRAPTPLAIAIGSLLAAVPLLWAFAVPSRRARVLATSGAVLGGALTLLLRGSTEPARDATRVSLVILAVAALLVVLERNALRRSPALFGAALLGVASAGFGHYFWVRVDRPHLIPYLVVGAASAFLAFHELRPPARWAIAAVLLLDYPVFFRGTQAALFPIEALWQGGLPTARGGWPAAQVPGDAAAAVAAADRIAGEGGAFVAVASSHAVADRNPILLFLLSRRLPYTRWYAYDPGVQTSPAVQREMASELARSGSPSAVVWRAEAWTPRGANPVPLPRTAFDQEVDRLYPVTAARYGPYEVRFSAGAPGLSGSTGSPPKTPTAAPAPTLPSPPAPR